MKAAEGEDDKKQRMRVCQRSASAF